MRLGSGLDLAHNLELFASAFGEGRFWIGREVGFGEYAYLDGLVLLVHVVDGFGAVLLRDTSRELFLAALEDQRPDGADN